MSIPIGTRCIVSGLKEDVEYNGNIVIVVSDAHWVDEDLNWQQFAETENYPDDSWYYPVECLYPIENDEDSSNADEVVSWDDGVWRPTLVPATQ